MLTVYEWEQVRKAYYIEGKSIRQIARETRRARRTIQRMVDSDEPPSYQRQVPIPTRKLGPYKERIETMLKQNATMPRKQRWTSPRIYEVIRAEGYEGAESTVRHFVAQVRKQLKPPKLYLPLEFDPGTDAQVDWGEGEVIFNGRQVKVQLFYMKLSYSRRTFMMAFPSQKQESFFAGHVAAFNFFEGVPQRISYDNLKTAVKEVLTGRHRLEQEAFVQFRGHYLFESHFCAPRAGNEKGGVEHHVGYYRRRFLVPLPEVASFAELNAYLLTQCAADDTRQVSGQEAAIGVMWQLERQQLRPLPSYAYDCCRRTTAVLNRYSQIQVDSNRYSVPCDLAQRQLIVKLYPFEVHILRPSDSDPIAIHPRNYERGQEVIDPLHYLPLLQQRPGAFDHAKPLRQWRSQWPSVYEDLLAQLQQKWPDGRGVREFIAILYLHREHAQPVLVQAIEWALAQRCAHVDGIKLRLTQLALKEPAFSQLDLQHHPHLQQIGQQAVSIHAYDILVGGNSCLPQ
jgi:transposase